MVAIVINSLQERIQESVMLKIWGGSQALIWKIFLIEFGGYGVVAGVIGTLSAVTISNLLGQAYFEIPWHFPLKWMIFTLVSLPLLLIVFAVIAAKRVFQAPAYLLLRRGF